jgi:hypothetical protein
MTISENVDEIIVIIMSSAYIVTSLIFMCCLKQENECYETMKEQKYEIEEEINEEINKDINERKSVHIDLENCFVKENKKTVAFSNKTEIIKPNHTIYMDDYFDTELEKIKENLVVIGNIKKQEKLWINEEKLIIDTSYFPQISRWMYSQNREKIVAFIVTTIDGAIKYMHKFDEDTFDKTMLKNLISTCIFGLENLRETYPDKKVEIDGVLEKIFANNIE